MKRRGLRPDELELWKKVADTTERLEAQPFKPEIDPKQPGKKKINAPEKRSVPLPDFRVGSKASGFATPHRLAPSISEQLGSVPLQMDKKAFGKMKRGKLKPEAKLDLHGMTIDRAHPVLMNFILDAAAQGKRLVLVITGKGKHRDDGGPIPVPFGVLKHNVPQWLRMAPLSNVVLQVTEAHLKHGGTGAYYVYLKRHR